MAWSEEVTEVQNPAKKRGPMAHKLTAKQIRFFGSKRQKAALKAARKRKRARHSSAKHRSRAKPKSNAAPKKRATARHSAHKHSGRSKPVKKNPQELVAFLTGNPAKRSNKKVAHSKAKKRATARHSNAGHRGKKTAGRRHSGRRGNPAGIPIKDWAFGGAGVLAGFFGSAGITQMILGGGNTGGMSYAVTAGTAIGLAILSHMFFPKLKALTFGVAAGGAANILRRVAQDYTPLAPYLSAPGMGDYMVANWGPPQMIDGINSAMAPVATTGAVMASQGISAVDYQDVRGSGGGRPC